jgi:hypothetical protein
VRRRVRGHCRLHRHPGDGGGGRRASGGVMREQQTAGACPCETTVRPAACGVRATTTGLLYLNPYSPI